MILVESLSPFNSLFEHDLFGKPLHTFPDHALARNWPDLQASRRSSPLVSRLKSILTGGHAVAPLLQVICLPGSFAKSLSSPVSKNISLRDLVETALSIRASRARMRGVSRSSRTLGAGCGGRDSVVRRMTLRGRRSRVVLISRRSYQARGVMIS